MNAIAKKSSWSTTDDIAGRYALTLDKARPVAFEPAANEVAARDFDAEADDALALVKDYVTRQPADAPTTMPLSKTNTSLAQPEVSELLAPTISVKPDPQQAYFISTQEWDGYITEVGEDTFEAVIYPVGQAAEFRQDAVTVPVWLVDEDARHRVKPGAIFRLATGRQRRKRQIIHGARVYFRLIVDMRKQEGLDEGALEAFFGD